MSVISSDDLRQRFSQAMSQMYRTEVPLYGSLLELVSDVNHQILQAQPDLKHRLQKIGHLERLAEERHGAIRLGRADELFNMRRLFAIFGMHPVAYYDLAVAGIPVHSTAFRPVEANALAINPFRVFTSLLRIDLLDNIDLRQKAEAVLASRKIFSDKLLSLIESAEWNHLLTDDQAEELINMAVDIFRWHDQALVDAELYTELHDSHRLIADVVSFKGPHINHLTPASLDIDKVQSLMPQYSMVPKAVVEGPPRRQCPVLLRQTSFKALQEPVKFANQDTDVNGFHTARFGEIEQRGIALTAKGQQLYDVLLTKTREQITPKADGSNAEEYRKVLAIHFAGFPDTYKDLKEQELAFFHYSICELNIDKHLGKGKTIEQLVALDLVRYDPIIYEDFLPVSAAGIFQSNLGDKQHHSIEQQSNQALFEEQLGCHVIDPFTLYEKQQQESIRRCLEIFNN